MLYALRSVVHNHPSGDPTPSKADIAVTRDIVKAAGPLGVTVHDNVNNSQSFEDLEGKGAL